jgi:hypothetical protein
MGQADLLKVVAEDAEDFARIHQRHSQPARCPRHAVAARLRTRCTGTALLCLGQHRDNRQTRRGPLPYMIRC